MWKSKLVALVWREKQGPDIYIENPYTDDLKEEWNGIPPNKKWLFQIVSNERWLLYAILIIELVLIWTGLIIFFEIVTM